MEKPIVIANWKMNPLAQKEAKDLFDSIEKGVKEISNAETVICPPFVFLPLFKSKEVAIGGQDVFFEQKGAYTGEVSAKMLSDSGCKYVIIGHSERRKYFKETDESANKKIKAALEENLLPIFCIGESEKERSLGKEKNVIEEQLKKGLNNISENIIIAYEPVWAIGTGKACSVKDAKEMREFIEKTCSALKIVYGGSVNAKNAADYIKKAGYDGLLVGGASLNAEEFVKIVKESA